MGAVGREWELRIIYAQLGARDCRFVRVRENLRAQKPRMLVLLACVKTACVHKPARNISVLANLPQFNQSSHNSYMQNGGVVHPRWANAQSNYVLALL